MKTRLTRCLQNLETQFKALGYKVQTHELSHFHDDYGLKTGEGDEEDEEDDDEDEYDEDGSEGSEEDSEED